MNRQRGQYVDYAPDKPIATPYDDVKRRLDSDRRAATREAMRWRCLGYALMGVVVVLSAGVIYLGATEKQIVHIVEVDRAGGYEYRGTAEGQWMDPTKNPEFVRMLLRSTLRKIRSISSDLRENNREDEEAWNMLTGRARTKIAKWNTQDANNPSFLLPRGITREIRHLASLQQTPRTWQLDWEETTRGPDGEAIGRPETWRAVVSTVSAPPPNEEARKNNPLGFYVEDIGWDLLATAQP